MALFPIIENEVVGQDALVDDAVRGTRRGPVGGGGDVLAYTQIGKGKPLRVVIDHVYTGKYPKSGGLFGGDADVAVVSGVKDYAVFAASTRALNLVSRKASARSHLQSSAFENGTSLVLYSPAVMTDSLTLTIEMAVDSFDRGLLDTISNGLQSAAGIPLMLPYSGYLLGAGQVTKVVAGLADALFDSRPAFSITETLNFGLPGRPLAVADHWLLTHNQQLFGLRYDPAQGLVTSTGQQYSGDDPYVVLTIDGAQRDELNSFAPTAASSAILQKFFQMRERSAASIETVVEALQLASDMRLRKQAETLKDRIAAATDAKTKEMLQIDLDAIVKNIATEVLRP